MDFHGTQELVGCVVAVHKCDGIDKVMPCAFLGLLEVPSGAGVDGGQRLEEQGGARTSRLVGRYDVKRIEHRSYPFRAASVDNPVRVVNILPPL